MSKKIGILVFGETDNVSYLNTYTEAQALARQGAQYIRESKEEPHVPVSFVGLMLDANWLDNADSAQAGVTGGLLAGICYDTVFQSRSYHNELHKRFKQPCFLFTAFRKRLDMRDYNYYLRMVGITEWKQHELMCVETIQAFLTVQKQQPIDYSHDSVMHTIERNV